jgi:light-regulated signal transduction histidine kinase (bacteriophytochrome)
MLSQADLKTLVAGCALEPIHIPGKIQAHGFLFACDSSFCISYVSANVHTYLGIDPAALLGRDLFSLFADSSLKEQWLMALGDSNAAAYLGACRFRPGPNRDAAAMATESLHTDLLYEATAHWRDGLFIAEFEAPQAASPSALSLSVNGFVTRLQEARTVPAICALAVDEIKRITGFGRVLAYAFDADGHGHVIAEAVDPGYERYFGLRFPASDIPAQARALYRLNSIRIIPDAHYEPSGLITTADRQAHPLDLSLSHLRSVSPVHLQYMVNMGTLASMSISILVEGRLWGLVSCHNLTPRNLPVSTRTTCELLGKILSLQVEAREGHDQTKRRLELRNMMVAMLASMADKDSVSLGLRAIPEVGLAFAGASGVAVVEGGVCHRIGETPEDDELRALTDWLHQSASRDVFSTDTLAADFLISHAPGASADVSAPARSLEACGLLAVSISEIHPNYILWFRPEVIRTVNWAGQPTKEYRVNNGIEALSPRTSFSIWEEIVRGQSLPWSQEEIDAAVTLRDSVRGIVLRKAEELAEMAGELRHANGELEAFSYSVSHDLRAPLRHIAGYTELLQEYESADLSKRALHYLDSIGESVNFAGTLVDELLAFSQMGRSALRLSNVDVVALVHNIQRELAPDFEGREIDWVIQPLPSVLCDGAFIHLALRNLIANAIKYTRKNATARIEIGAQAGPAEKIIYVRDDGVGFDMQYVGKLFGVFQRLHSMEEFEGTGIGLANVRRIIERHGGRVWAEGAIGRGSTFYFALPNIIPKKLTMAARAADSEG